MAEGKHPFPSRTRKLSPPAPMVLTSRGVGRVGRRLVFFSLPHLERRSEATRCVSTGVDSSGRSSDPLLPQRPLPSPRASPRFRGSARRGVRWDRGRDGALPGESAVPRGDWPGLRAERQLRVDPEGLRVLRPDPAAAVIPIEVNTHRGGRQGLLRQRPGAVHVSLLLARPPVRVGASGGNRWMRPRKSGQPARRCARGAVADGLQVGVLRPGEKLRILAPSPLVRPEGPDEDGIPTEERGA